MKTRVQKRKKLRKSLKKFNKNKSKKHYWCFKCNQERHYTNKCLINIKSLIITNLDDYVINPRAIEEILNDNNSICEIISFYDYTKSELNQKIIQIKKLLILTNSKST